MRNNVKDKPSVVTICLLIKINITHNHKVAREKKIAIRERY